jgi:tripartite-type tricarboxylate transporter receptor subunit TctC
MKSRLSRRLSEPKMQSWRRLCRCCLTAACALVAMQSLAQDYPVKPIRILTAAPGGGVDFAARQIAQGLAAAFGQQVIVENHGGNAIFAADPVAKSAPDGYTLLFYGSGMWLTPFMRDKTPYDPQKDFAPVSLTNRSPNVLVVHPSLPVKNVKDLIALAKAKPGQLNFASSGLGASSHLAGALFNSMAGINIVHVPYRANAGALIDLIAGQVQLMFSTTTAAVPHLKTSKLKALAVTSLQPSALMPGVPTVDATGLRGYEAASINAMFAPAKTPPAVITRLSQETQRVLARQDVKDRLFANGLETVGSTPEELAGKVALEMSRLGKIIRESGAHED